MSKQDSCKHCMCYNCDTRWDDDDCSGKCNGCDGTPITSCGSFCGFVCNIDNNEK